MATSEAGKSTRRKKERVWTETELKYLALVLAEEKNPIRCFFMQKWHLIQQQPLLNKIFKDPLWSHTKGADP